MFGCSSTRILPPQLLESLFQPPISYLFFLFLFFFSMKLSYIYIYILNEFIWKRKGLEIFICCVVAICFHWTTTSLSPKSYSSVFKEVSVFMETYLITSSNFIIFLLLFSLIFISLFKITIKLISTKGKGQNIGTVCFYSIVNSMSHRFSCSLYYFIFSFNLF